MHVALKPLERLLLKTDVALIAEFSCRPDESLFPNCGPSNAHCIVFPSTSTKILRPGQPPVYENPTAVSLHNRGEEYGREAISAEGSVATWFTLDDGTFEEILFETGRRGFGDRPFEATQVRVPPAIMFRERRLIAQMIGEGADALTVEEELIALTRIVLALGSERQRPARDSRLVRRAVARMLVSFAEPSSLADLARDIGVAPAHLSHTFRATTGITLTAFRQRLRLITSLDLLPAYAGNVTKLAFELGYSSHSHFTSAFHALFDSTPTQFISEAVTAPALLGSRVMRWMEAHPGR